MTEKFVGYFRFLDACDAGGCPVCRCVKDESRARLDALLYEQVTDPETRGEIRASRGFCNWHTWMLLEVENSLFGSAILYEDLLRLLLERSRNVADAPRTRRGWFGRRRRPRSGERRHPRCPLCVGVAAAADRYLTTIVAHVDDPDLRAAYARSDGLCASHMLQALETTGDGARELLARTVPKWTRLRDDIGRLLGKYDHRNTERVTDAEAASCRRAFEVLAGAPGLFGNDLGAPPRA